MKRCIYFLFLSLSSFLTIVHCRAQNANVKTYNKFLHEYRVTSENGFNKAALVHPLAIASNYFVQQQVYPNEDAVRLVQGLNPKIDMSSEANVVKADTRLVLPIYPGPLPYVRNNFMAVKYVKDAKPDSNLNQTFKNYSNAFNEIFVKLTVPNDALEKKYYDSLAFFNSKILPYINSNAQSIPSLQMRYFNTELKALIESFKVTPAVMTHLIGKVIGHERASYIVEDFYEIANPVQITKRSIYTQKVSRFGGASTEDKKESKLIFLNDLMAKPFACNLYVFARDEHGKQKQGPELAMYDVWVGDKMSFVKDVAPELYGFEKMNGQASTLPFNVGLGKWMIVLKKQGSNGPYLHQEIGIFIENAKDPDNPDARKFTYTLD